MDPMPKEEADAARETGSRGCIPRWRKCGIADGWGLIPGLVEEYSLIRRVLRGEYLRANRIVVSPACCLRMQKRVALMEGMRQSRRDGRQKLESTFCVWSERVGVN